MSLDLCWLSFHIQFKILVIQLNWFLFALIEKVLIEFSSALTLETLPSLYRKIRSVLVSTLSVVHFLSVSSRYAFEV